MLTISDAKRRKIEKYLNEGRSQNEITKLCSCGKQTVQKVSKLMEKGSNTDNTDQVPPDSSAFLSVEDVDKYIKKCMVTGKDPNTSLLNTGIKLLELKNKIEPEAMKKMKEKERVEFDDCIEDALNYVNTLRPDYQVGVPSKPGSDDKTSESEG